ncbi:nodulation protein NolB, partial [Methylobacterium sp. CG08_land_8_20_14_0_20_71_15]
AVEGPTLKVAMRPPGPAAAPLRAEAAPAGPEIAGQPTTQPGQSRNPGFDAMLQQLEQVSGQVIQVSVVSKTTGSFTGSLNKLLSSG